ncbi:protein of unknown function [Methanoculleus bourgensis]|uniref:Uncharacterized protein n=1 Tax=Methanoculleus bourgensis TaxID=83986 RepID=A0A0X3BQ02_9EURY|nr:protein of unknown function [Methanoculleus bourgensis]
MALGGFVGDILRRKAPDSRGRRVCFFSGDGPISNHYGRVFTTRSSQNASAGRKIAGAPQWEAMSTI